MKTTNLPMYSMSPRIPNIQYSQFIEHIGKIEITEHTTPKIISILMKVNPHTLKVNGKYA